MYIHIIILFGVYKICYTEFKCDFRYNFIKFHQNILNNFIVDMQKKI